MLNTGVFAAKFTAINGMALNCSGYMSKDSESDGPLPMMMSDLSPCLSEGVTVHLRDCSATFIKPFSVDPVLLKKRDRTSDVGFVIYMVG